MTNQVIVLPSVRGYKIVRGGNTVNTLYANILELSDRKAYIQANLKQLIGIGIGMNEAAAKYDLKLAFVSKLCALGHVSKIGEAERGKVLIDEADIAYVAAAYHVLNVQRGQKLFNKDGSIYIPRPLMDKALKQNQSRA